MNQWQKKLNNLNKWWHTCKIDNDKPYNIYDYFSLDKIKGSVLDIGCGQPKGTWYINKFKDYTGIDPTPYNKDIIQGVAEDLPFTDKSFDNVLFMSTLQHCEDPEKAIHEIKRVCRGRLFSTVYCSKPNDLILHEFNLDTVRYLYEKYFDIKKIEYKDNVVYAECKC